MVFLTEKNMRKYIQLLSLNSEQVDPQGKKIPPNFGRANTPISRDHRLMPRPRLFRGLRNLGQVSFAALLSDLHLLFFRAFCCLFFHSVLYTFPKIIFLDEQTYRNSFLGLYVATTLFCYAPEVSQVRVSFPR
jgi:hypothetical protein